MPNEFATPKPTVTVSAPNSATITPEEGAFDKEFAKYDEAIIASLDFDI